MVVYRFGNAHGWCSIEGGADVSWSESVERARSYLAGLVGSGAESRGLLVGGIYGPAYSVGGDGAGGLFEGVDSGLFSGVSSRAVSSLRTDVGAAVDESSSAGGQQSDRLRGPSMGGGDECMDSVSSGIGGGEVPSNSQGVRGPNYERNQASRARRRAARQGSKSRAAFTCGLDCSEIDGKFGLRSAFALCDSATRKSLAESRARRLIVENEQAKEKAQRQLDVLRASDITKEIKQNQTRLTAAIERNMVSIEKTHATLVATGNVPGEVGGFAHTIVGSGSISPNSSASLQEFRKCQKDLLDAEEYNARLIATLKEVGVEVPHSAQSDRNYNRDMGIWTDNSENRKIVDEQFPDHDVLYNVYGMEGKMKIIPTFDAY